jgi:Domain of unknown function (DUF1998).
LQYFHNNFTHQGNFELVLYDRTPGGAGHVRRLDNQGSLEGVLQETLRLMEQCDCGGEEKDSSCYGCLRGYYNQPISKQEFGEIEKGNEEFNENNINSALKYFDDLLDNEPELTESEPPQGNTTSGSKNERNHAFGIAVKRVYDYSVPFVVVD